MDHTDIHMEDFMDVVYKCKFCPYTCTQSPSMGAHVKEKHLKSRTLTQTNGSGNVLKDNQGPVVSMAVGSTPSGGPPVTTAGSDNCNKRSSIVITNPVLANSSCNNTSTSHFNIQVSDEMIAFTPDGGQAFLDKGLATGVPVTQAQSMMLSNSSTPDLTDLINMVKPVDDSGTDCHSVRNGNQTHLSLESLVQLQPSTASSFIATDLPPGLNSSQSLAVMAIQLPGMNSESGATPHYIVEPAVEPENLRINESTETKEFLLCGLCKLAFTSMEDCQAHMQTEHRELMQSIGVSIGVQVGGVKRGRKRKGESQSSRLAPKIKEEPYLDPDDLEWLPTVSEGNKTTHRDGRTRRKVIPPKALKEDYVLGRRLIKKRQRQSASALGYSFLCPMMSCKARFKSKQSMDVHLSCHNLDDSSFTCPECQASHDFWKHLRLHLWKSHQIDVDLLTCDSCGYKTDTVHKMSIHKEIHTDEKPYKCHLCGKGFRQASQQKNHMTIHKSLESKQESSHWFSSKKCDVCERVFANSKCLTKHKEAVHAKVKPFSCVFCDHTTARKAMMQLHMRTHTGEKPFKCDVCSYTTGDHNSMRRHKMRHTGEKQYRCTLCPYTCIQSISLKQHMKNKHPGISGGIFQCSRCPFRSINQNHYQNHVQDHKRGLIPDVIIPPKLDIPKAKRSQKSNVGVGKPAGGTSVQNGMESVLMKHPQFHTIVPGEDSSSPSTVETLAFDTTIETRTEAFSMQVTMLPGGDTQVSAEDMARLSESPGLLALKVSPLQLIYATLSSISEQTDMNCVEEGQSSLLTIELVGGIQTAVLTSLQDGVIVHSITYHLPSATSGQPARDTLYMEEGGSKDGGHFKALEGTEKDECEITISSVEESDKADIKTEKSSGESKGEQHKSEIVLPSSSMGQNLISIGDSQQEEPGKVVQSFYKLNRDETMYFLTNSDNSSGDRGRDRTLNLKGKGGKDFNTQDVILVNNKGMLVVNREDQFIPEAKSDAVVDSDGNLTNLIDTSQGVPVLNTQDGDVHLISVNFLNQNISDSSCENNFCHTSITSNSVIQPV